MLGKLIHKDFQSTSRFFLPLIFGYVGASILGKILMESMMAMEKNVDAFGNINSNLFNMLSVFSMIYLTLFIFYLVAYYIMTSVFIVYDFYKTMVSDQAYLTHTLPVKASTLIHSKVIVSAIWQIIINVIVLLSGILLLAGHVDFSQIGELIGQVLKYNAGFKELMGISLGTFCFYIVFILFLELISGPLMFFASIALGHLFGKHRILGAILSYAGFYMAMQIISTVVMVFMGYSLNGFSNQAFFRNYFGNTMLFSAIFSLVTTALFYWITCFVFTKKLNLE